jgi:hypothetical protein
MRLSTRALMASQMAGQHANSMAMFLERGAITQAQHDKSLHDLREKMGETD